jgi:hypothetical protein
LPGSFGAVQAFFACAQMKKTGLHHSDNVSQVQS